MDLFDDLPEPETKRTSVNTQQIKPQSWDNVKVDFFSDLPLPSSTTENKGIKRKLDESENDSSTFSETSENLFSIHGFYTEKKGEREEMQDFHVLIDDFHKMIPHLHSSISRLSYYAVFDGHGGVRASRFASSQLHLNLAQKFPKGSLSQIDKDIRRTMVDVFRKTDEEFLKQATKSKPSWKDGTTAIIVLVLQNILYISNLGDSKAILCRYNKETKKHVAVPLSVDHSPTDYKERMRIQKAGGHVRDGRVMGIIEVSRSIGDGQYKALGITSIPDIKRCQLTDDDVFILLACDGLWKVFTSDEVLDIVLESRKAKNILNEDEQVFKELDSCADPSNKQDTEICYETACNRLVNESIRKHSGDNVTIVIISIKKNQ